MSYKSSELWPRESCTNPHKHHSNKILLVIENLFHLFSVFFPQLAFTILFDLETMFKIWCLGFRGYIRRSVHKFEFLLAVMTSLHVISYFYRTHMTYFQVWRTICVVTPVSVGYWNLVMVGARLCRMSVIWYFDWEAIHWKIIRHCSLLYAVVFHCVWKCDLANRLLGMWDLAGVGQDTNLIIKLASPLVDCVFKLMGIYIT